MPTAYVSLGQAEDYVPMAHVSLGQAEDYVPRAYVSLGQAADYVPCLPPDPKNFKNAPPQNPKGC